MGIEAGFVKRTTGPFNHKLGQFHTFMEHDSQISISRFPISMMIRCKECGQHFDIVIISKGSHDYLCPACGMRHSCDYANFMAKAVEACKITLEKRGRLQ